MSSVSPAQRADMANTLKRVGIAHTRATISVDVAAAAIEAGYRTMIEHCDIERDKATRVLAKLNAVVMMEIVCADMAESVTVKTLATVLALQEQETAATANQGHQP